MMAACFRVCLQSSLKILNSVMGLFGMALILYSLWMIRACFPNAGDFSQGFSDCSSTPSWFIYTFLVLGIFLCVLTCSGHIATETASSSALSCYAVVHFLLLILEAAIAGDILLNRNWEEDFPRDPTGSFDQLKDFVRKNSGLCELTGLMFVAVQVSSIFLALNLRTRPPDCRVYDESDDDSLPTTLPLLRKHAPNAPRVPDRKFSENGDSWIVRIHGKVFAPNDDSWIVRIHDKICR